MTFINTTDRANDQPPEAIAARLGVGVESHTQLGVTPEFIWYEANRLQRDMAGWSDRLQRLVDVAEQRHKDMLKMLAEVMAENRGLKKKLAGIHVPTPEERAAETAAALGIQVPTK